MPLEIVDQDAALLTEVEAAEMLALTDTCLKAWRQRDEGPPFCRLGRAVRYRRADLLNWVASSTVRPMGRAHDV